MKKNIIITGANGYIGLHLVKKLRLLGYQVVTATRDNSGDIKMDFSNPEEVKNLRIDNIDTMIHTVSPNEGLYRNKTYTALSEGITGIHAALDFCVDNKIKNFIYFSSFHVFGNQGGILNEETNISPMNDYGLSHSIAEQTVQLFNRKGLINGWVIRPSNLFGVPVDCAKFKRWNLVPFLFCKEAVEKMEITLLTPGNQLRNFVDVVDVVERVQWILDEKPTCRIVHANGNETLSVFEYAQLVQKIAKEKFELNVIINRPDRLNSPIDFEFTSIHDRNLIGNIEIFVEDMLKKLIENIYDLEVQNENTTNNFK